VAKLYAIGVGPGDPELLTRKAERLLKAVDLIMAPFSRKGDEGIALEIVREFLDPKRQQIVTRFFPMTSDPDILADAWRRAAEILADHVENGKNAAFITIGDPLLYSTFIYIKKIFGESYPELEIEIVPGISSINTASSVTGIPLAEAGQRIAVIPATSGIEAVEAAINGFETVVLLKIKSLYPEILELLRRIRPERDVVLVEKAGCKGQKIINDREFMAIHHPDYLSLMIVRSL